jgi:cytochrome c oxidase subunit 2
MSDRALAAVRRGEPERLDVGGNTSRSARRLLLAGLSLGVLALSGCTEAQIQQWKRLGYPPPAGDRTPYIQDLWWGAWIAAAVVGVLVWGLIGWASTRYRRKNLNYLPKQNRYNLPMEIMYTIVPFIIIGVLFYYTILAQDKVLAADPKPQHTIHVVGQKWSWTFNYKEKDNPAIGQDVYESGTINHSPDLYLPVGQSVHFELSSPDVIHSFWIPSFYTKLDVIPGKDNNFYTTPTTIGTFPGKCAELCGTYHSAMIFNVHIVSEADYNAYLKTLIAKGQTGEATGPKDANSPVNPNPEASAASEEGSK